MLGQQVVNGAPGAAARQESATKRKAGNAGYGRNTQAAGWANGQLPVAMQQATTQ